MINRRQLIKSLLLTAGVAASPTLIAAMANGSHQHHMQHNQASKSKYAYKFLSGKEIALISVISEIIIPKTTTPGANDVGVTEFIDLMLADWYDDKDSWLFIEGLRSFNTLQAKKHRKEFLSLPAKQQFAEIETLDANVLTHKETNASISNFYKQMKQLTLIGFYTSEQGMAKELKYHGPIAEFDFSPSGPPGSLTRY